MLLEVFHAMPTEIRTGWFVESLCTQTLVVFVIRNTGSVFGSEPSLRLIATASYLVLVALVKRALLSPSRKRFARSRREKRQLSRTAAGTARA